MLQSRAVVIALILLLSPTLPEVQSRSFFDQDRHDLLAVPGAIVSYIYETVNRVSAKVNRFVLDIVQSPTVVAARQRFAKEAARVSVLFEQLFEKLNYLWHSKMVGY